MPGMGAPTRARFLAAAIILVDGRPGAAFGFFFGNATLLVAFRDMVGLAFLFVGVFGLVAARHDFLADRRHRSLLAKPRRRSAVPVSARALRPPRRDPGRRGPWRSAGT